MRKSNSKSSCFAQAMAATGRTTKKAMGWRKCKCDWKMRRRRNKFTVPDEIREMVVEAAKCRDPVRRKLLRKRARKARREFDAGRAALPGGKVIHRPVVTKFWNSGRASEDRDEWTEEVRAHCESAVMTKLRRPKCSLRGSVTREVVVIAKSLSRADVYGSQSTEFSAHAGK